MPDPRHPRGPDPILTRHELAELLAAGVRGRSWTAVCCERDLQDLVEAVLRGAGVRHTREHRLDARSRLDFLVDRCALECKVGEGAGSVRRQLARYLASPDVAEALLVTTRARHRVDMGPLVRVLYLDFLALGA